MELFKTHPAIGSRGYPNPGLITVMTVPLYSGFMYSAVGSFIFQAWELLKIRFNRFPRFDHIVPIALLIYLNFFTHHFIPDIRNFLLVLIILVAYNVKVYYTINTTQRHMPALVGLFLVGFCLWVAENLATLGGAWVYPEQTTTWQVVSLHKLYARFLLFIVSFVVVSAYKMKFGRDTEKYIV